VPRVQGRVPQGHNPGQDLQLIDANDDDSATTKSAGIPRPAARARRLRRIGCLELGCFRVASWSLLFSEGMLREVSDAAVKSVW
jgi:hypothetical protein